MLKHYRANGGGGGTEVRVTIAKIVTEIVTTSAYIRLFSHSKMPRPSTAVLMMRYAVLIDDVCPIEYRTRAQVEDGRWNMRSFQVC